MSEFNCAYKRCATTKNAPIISVKEQKSKFIIKNPAKKKTLQVKVDGCLPIAGAKCDYLFEIGALQAVYYVELKGKNIKHALEQLLGTLSERFIDKKHRGYQKYCVVVSSRVPRMDPTIQKLKKQCRKNKKADLTIRNKQYEIII